MKFQMLPVDILWSIYGRLDPIGLISLSQTCSLFRGMIRPEKTHFAERLLALELLPQYGAGVPIFRARDNFLDPGWETDAWEAMRWACTACLRLLPHKDFNNHALLRLGYRKPIPGTPAANLVTSWTPSKRGMKWGRKYRRGLSDQERARRRRYHIAVTHGQDLRDSKGRLTRDSLHMLQACGMAGFLDMGKAEFEAMTAERKEVIFDENALAVEQECCGYKRLHRRCNECRFKNGELKPCSNNYNGTQSVPAVASRRLTFSNLVDRNFVGISERLGIEPPPVDPPLFLYQHEFATKSWWTTFMLRCPQCERWQELRAFRYGDVHAHWRPRNSDEGDEVGTMLNWDQEEVTTETLNELTCSSCFAKEHGTQKLEQALLQWIRYLLNCDISRVEHQFLEGFGGNFTNTPSQDKYRDRIDNILTTLPRKTHILLADVAAGLGRLTYEDVALLRVYHDEVVAIWDEIDAQPNRSIMLEVDVLQDWLFTWRHDFAIIEQHWHWMRQCEAAFEAHPELLVAWALDL